MGKFGKMEREAELEKLANLSWTGTASLRDQIGREAVSLGVIECVLLGPITLDEISYLTGAAIGTVRGIVYQLSAAGYVDTETVSVVYEENGKLHWVQPRKTSSVYWFKDPELFKELIRRYAPRPLATVERLVDLSPVAYPIKGDEDE